MKRKSIYLFGFVMLMWTSPILAQTGLLKERQIGDTLPDVILKGFVRDTNQIIKLKELHDHKLLLLDFWATWCGACIEGMAKYDALKKQFGDQIEIVAVGYERYKTITEFLKRDTALKTDRFRILARDTILTFHLFPHRLLPHLVWIDQAGKVIAITGGSALTAANIQKALDQKPLTARTKTDNLDFSSKNIFKPFRLMDTAFLCRSIFTPVCNGIISFESFQGGDPAHPGKNSRIFMGNQSIRRLYWVAAFRRNIVGNNYGNMLLEVRDSLKYMEPRYAALSFKSSKYMDDEDWAQENLYCYELKFPNPVADSLLSRYMIEDLNRYLNLNGRFENRNVPCYILKYHPVEQRCIKSSVLASDVVYRKGYPIKIQGQTVKKLVELLNRYVATGQVVDETGISPEFRFDADLEITHSLTQADLEQLISRYGFTIEKGIHKAPVFVISEK